MRSISFVAAIAMVWFAGIVGCCLLNHHEHVNTANIEHVLMKPLSMWSDDDASALSVHVLSNIIDVTGNNLVYNTLGSSFKHRVCGNVRVCEILAEKTRWQCVFEQLQLFTNNYIIECKFEHLDDCGTMNRYILSYETNSTKCAVFVCSENCDKYKYEGTTPKYTLTQDDAVKNVKLIAKKFGINDYCEEGKWRIDRIITIGSSGQISVYASRIINGFPSECTTSVSYFDAPIPKLHMFGNLYNNLYDIEKLPTNASVSRGEAKALADIYVRKYYDDQALVPGMQFTTNRLEYVRPNYYYIHPGNFGGLKKRPFYPLRLAWLCEYKKPDRYPNGFPNSYHAFPLVIYVDAVNGEMLGGHD